MKLFSFILLFLLLPNPASEKISWRENKPLTWKDFQGTPNPNAGFVASSNTGIHFYYSFSTNQDKEVKVTYTVESFFNQEKSWFLADQVTPHILNHEQAHFDITELHARILRKRLSERKFTANAKSEIEGIYQKVDQERRAMQIRFDKETDHSRNEEKEIAWEKQIAKQLANYGSWK